MAAGEAPSDRPAQKAPGPELLILCYHALSRRWSSPLAVGPDRLGAQVRFLLGRGWVAKTLAEAISQPARRTLVLTFDDAYHSVLSEGLPVLERLGVAATLFVPTDLADRGGLMTDVIPIKDAWVGDQKEMRGMSWEEVRRLAEAGWEIGSHTCSHPDLRALGSERVTEELRRSRSICEERLQRACHSFAYPYGFHDERTKSLVAEAGYRRAVTLELHLLTPLHGRGLLDLPREGIYPTTSWPKFLINSSRAIRRARYSAPFGALAGLLQ